MCTMIAQQVKVSGSGKAGSGWFTLDTASVSYDHPYNLALEYALNLDFTNLAGEPSARVAVELDWISAQKLLEAIQQVMKQAVAGGFVVRGGE